MSKTIRDQNFIFIIDELDIKWSGLHLIKKGKWTFSY